MRRSLEKYVESEFGMEPDQQFVDTLESFIKLKSSKNERNVIRDCVYKFSFKRLENILTNSCFRALLFHYNEEANHESLKNDARIGLSIIMKMISAIDH